jgi:hypothetical protein
MPNPFRHAGVRGASHAIRAAVATWPGTHDAPHRFGGVEFLLGEREIGHLHGDRLLDVPFPRAVHDALIAGSNGRVEPHHVLPESGWISFWLQDDGDVDQAIAILRRSYDVISAQLARRKAQAKATARAERAS